VWQKTTPLNREKELSFLGQASRILLAPFQRLPDDLVFVRTGELLQKSLASFLVNERSERTALRAPPSVQLDRKVAVINGELKRKCMETPRKPVG
jgi:hypothetical protein